MNVPFDSLSADARIWIYQADRLLTDSESARAREVVGKFAGDWTAHSQSLKASAVVIHNLFLVLAVDESANDASGCSIDASTRFIKNLGGQLGISFLDKLRVAFREGPAIRVMPLDNIVKSFNEGRITENTIVFNNLLETKGQMAAEWEIPLAKSWVKQRIG